MKIKDHVNDIDLNSDGFNWEDIKPNIYESLLKMISTRDYKEQKYTENCIQYELAKLLHYTFFLKKEWDDRSSFNNSELSLYEVQEKFYDHRKVDAIEYMVELSAMYLDCFNTSKMFDDEFLDMIIELICQIFKSIDSNSSEWYCVYLASKIGEPV